MNWFLRSFFARPAKLITTFSSQRVLPPKAQPVGTPANCEQMPVHSDYLADTQRQQHALANIGAFQAPSVPGPTKNLFASPSLHAQKRKPFRDSCFPKLADWLPITTRRSTKPGFKEITPVGRSKDIARKLKARPVESIEQAIDLTLKNQGQVVELLMCHRSDVDNEVIQSTPDQVLRLRAENEKVVVSRASKGDFVLDVSSGNSVDGPETLNFVNDYWLSVRIITSGHTGRLPGPGKVSQLTSDEQELLGVARWPGMSPYRERSPANRLYGRSFFQNTRIAGQLLADRKLGSFRELWHHASEWRMTTVASGNSQAFKPQQPRMPGETSFTRLSDQYEYFAERLEKQEGVPAQVEFLLASDSPYSDHPEQIPKIESTRHQQFGQIGSEKIPLTRVDFGHAKEEEREFLEQFTDSVLFLTHSLVHTDPKHIPKIVEHVESLFVRVTSGNRLPQENLTDLAEIHWWLANAMPDRRGSAAKTEFCIRSLAYANGIELPPFQRGILPDMESFDPSLSCADFVEKYKTEFFTRSIA